MLFIATRGRPKGSKNNTAAKKQNTTEKIKREAIKKICISCTSDKASRPLRDFYRSYSPFHSDGYIPICKDCLFGVCFDKSSNDINIEAFKNILRQIDKPFISKVLQSSINQYNVTYSGKNVPLNNREKIIRYYFKNINSLRQYTTLNWNEGLEVEEKDSIKNNGDGIITKIEDTYEMKINKNSKDDEEVYYLEDEDEFELTKDIILLFGSGFKKRDYKAMWTKYEFIRQNCPDITNLHVEALVRYVKYAIKEENAIANGDYVEAEKWNNMAIKAAEKAKINPSQLSKSDLQGGLNSFSEFFQAIEQAVDVIPILPEFKARPNDVIDFNIWCLINYLRDLEGKPLCEYSDVYKFYDERKAEYIEQYGDIYGIFSEDNTEKNRESIKKFITLPKEYADIDLDVENEEVLDG